MGSDHGNGLKFVAAEENRASDHVGRIRPSGKLSSRSEIGVEALRRRLSPAPDSSSSPGASSGRWTPPRISVAARKPAATRNSGLG